MSKNSLLLSEYQQLLRDLKGVVEGLLISQVANVWNVYGGLNRLHSVVENIFKHQFRVLTSNGVLDCWVFIQGLSWLQPDITNSTLSVDSEYQPHLPTHLKTDKVSLWLYRSLESHTLSQKLSWLLSDKEHLVTCYYENAFMLQEKYTEATLICLRAVERSDPSLLSEIDPCLFLNNLSAKDFHKVHRRCSSFPDAMGYRKWNILTKKLSSENVVERASDVVDSPKKIRKKVEEETKIEIKKVKNIYGKLKPWRSMPNLHFEGAKLRQRSYTMIKSSATTPNSPMHFVASKKEDKLSPSVIQVNYSDLIDSEKYKKSTHCEHWKKLNARKALHQKKSNIHTLKSNATLSSEEVPKRRYDSEESGKMSTKSLPCKQSKKDSLNLALNLVQSAPEYTISILPGEKDYQKRPKKSFIEDGGSSVLPMSTGYFPRPIKGQTLTSFLSSSQFSRTNAELDRENAHFSISEAMIAAIEQIKWKRDLKLDEEQVESDEEINNLKQRIRMRRRQKQEEKRKKMWDMSLTSEKRTDTTTDTNTSSLSNSPDTPSESLSSDEVDDLEIDEAPTLSELKGLSGLSMSMASLYSEVDLLKRPRGVPDGASDILSAEGVALSLISKFNEKQLPRASDLEWLVSEQDAPQELLPLPKSWPVSPDEYTPLRGTSEWAPPRPQIIFTIHPTPVRKILIAKQNYRCAGCGMKVAPQYASRFRYCDYLGRYFCTGCHTNQLAVIPGKVLQKWDFYRYPVSNFSYRLLEQMYNDPLFRVIELNPNLLRKARCLEKNRTARLQLFYLKDFIFCCRYAETQQELLQKEVDYIMTDPEMYSLHDLVKIKSGDFLPNLVNICSKHVLECELCTARAFVCEICHKDESIYPWQFNKIARCDKCGSCYHKTCWKSLGNHCSKCVRLLARQS